MQNQTMHISIFNGVYYLHYPGLPSGVLGCSRFGDVLGLSLAILDNPLYYMILSTQNLKLCKIPNLNTHEQ